ncbi:MULTISPECIES: enoyl-CoA hydratase/isomerase family protein [Thermomonospora]|uniref:Enoyl-CoA hydratase/isomerase n=1 Tax=Thermomonospora curvata (strain ATCC 19995 / DSM 43183 / JCM 3096 / KCTC 9072 / NBRC 15933 / NCIMB 10081 / Henssen B9) TaxID=471852 RepID=D1A7W6_THECD|nr:MULTISPECIES: enoyl-CoA hydratase/isomerase family protein [Thermomonospora]ACY98488.1 Enoyl-CoA hydratase/isomerase [Thermomonospora curvata DSM 43183]PKK13634.1 MAG: enoyl-CoA hydratase/isomerase family protein [Thermomonospora sp. CIF 1]
MIDLQRDGDVLVLRLEEGENRFSPGFLDGVLEALDAAEKAEGPRALVTVGAGKFYSNGLDLDWLGANRDKLGDYLRRVQEMFARLLELPMPTVAAVNGHAFAGGAMLALCHDFAVMRTDRGFFCLPEVDLGMNFTPGMSALIQARLPKVTAHEAMITGRRYTAQEALAAGIVSQAVPEEQVLPAALERAAGLAGKDGPTVAKIRTRMYAQVLEALRGPLS